MVQTRREALTSLQSTTLQYPMIVNWMVRDALTHRLSREDPSQKADAADEEREYLHQRQRRLHAIFAASASLPDNLDLDLREQELMQTIILAHHPAICMSSTRL